MNANWGNKSVGSIVSALPAAVGVFKMFGIDYCCGGQKLLSKVTEEQKINRSKVEEFLDIAYENAQRSRDIVDFKALSQGDLSSYIETKHHTYLREALPQIDGVFNTVLKAHGKNHPELFELHKVFSRLKGDLDQHLIKEETMLFPAFNDSITAETRDISRQIKLEHEEAGKALAQMRRISNDYKPPMDACMTYQRLFTMLEELENDLHQHVHLENNILLVDI